MSWKVQIMNVCRATIARRKAVSEISCGCFLSAFELWTRTAYPSFSMEYHNGRRGARRRRIRYRCADVFSGRVGNERTRDFDVQLRALLRDLIAGMHTCRSELSRTSLPATGNNF